MSSERQRNSKKPSRRQNRSGKPMQAVLASDAKSDHKGSLLSVAAPTPNLAPPVALAFESLEQLITSAQSTSEPNAMIDHAETEAKSRFVTTTEPTSALEATPVSIAPRCGCALSDSSTTWSNAVESKLNALIEQSKAFERERIEIDSLREQLRTAIETAECRLHESSEAQDNTDCDELQFKLLESKQEIARLTTLLEHARNEYQSLLDFIESESPSVEFNPAFQNPEHEISSIYEGQINALNEQIDFLQGELTELRKHPVQHSDDADLRIQVEKLRSQLLEVRHEAVELRLQNNELSSRLARFQGPGESQRSESLTWEQRKEALLQQLEAETHSEEPCDPRKVLEIEKILHQTDAEIDRRDREIADLRSLLEQQSFAHDGIAVGVAAVAEMIENDSMIMAERMRLQELRQEWEQKQREAEIEMSMERAKLARERLELQERARSFADANPPQSAAEKQIVKENSRGRWLARLGLRDE